VVPLAGAPRGAGGELPLALLRLGPEPLGAARLDRALGGRGLAGGRAGPPVPVGGRPRRGGRGRARPGRGAGGGTERRGHRLVEYADVDRARTGSAAGTAPTGERGSGPGRRVHNPHAAPGKA